MEEEVKIVKITTLLTKFCMCGLYWPVQSRVGCFLHASQPETALIENICLIIQ